MYSKNISFNTYKSKLIRILNVNVQLLLIDNTYQYHICYIPRWRILFIGKNCFKAGKVSTIWFVYRANFLLKSLYAYVRKKLVSVVMGNRKTIPIFFYACYFFNRSSNHLCKRGIKLLKHVYHNMSYTART